jgi:nucleotide-binding universal stress UspA family protein
MYKRVLVPVDGSEVAESILPVVLEITNPRELDVILLNVNGFIPPRTIEAWRPFGVADVEAERAEAARYLNLLGAELRAGGARVHTRVRGGSPVAEILTVARNEAVDLIAMATHGRRGAARLLLGSVAEQVIRQSPVPVCLVRRTEKGMAGRRRDRGFHAPRAESVGAGAR